MIRNIRFFFVTDEKTILNKHDTIGLPMAYGILSSYLEKNGIQSSLTDCNHIASCCEYGALQIENLSYVYNKDRLFRYMCEGQDHILDTVARMFVHSNCMHADIYGVSIGADFSMMQIHLGIIIASYLKKTTNKVVIIGGNNISYLYIFKELYRDLLEKMIENFDFVIKGPGESSIVKIIQGINENRTKNSLSTIGGRLCIQQKNIMCNPENTPMVLRPCWDDVKLADYSYPFFKTQKENQDVYYKFPIALSTKIIACNKVNVQERHLLIPYIFNYNCVYQCAFCTQSDTDRTGLVIGNAAQVVKDIVFLSKQYNSSYFYFLNNYFPSSWNFIKDFHANLKAKGIQIYWSDCARVNGLTFEKLQLLYECGCRKLVFGFESASQKILNLIDKKIEINQVLTVLRWCKQIGILADLEIIIGLPYETEEDFMDTYQFLNKYQHLINDFWVNEYFIIPNSLMGTYPDKYGMKLIKNFTNYEEVLHKNKLAFLNGSIIDLTENARLWRFDETDRDHVRILLDNESKLNRIYRLKNHEFSQLLAFHNSLLKLREKEGCS